jgi:hypothetical protein
MPRALRPFDASLCIAACLAAALGTIPRAAAESPAGSGVVYSNLGPKGDRYDKASAWVEQGRDVEGGPQALCFAFISSGRYRATSVRVVLDAVPDYPGRRVDVVVAADNGGLPGKRLFSSRVSVPHTHLFRIAIPQSPAVELLAGRTYWVLVLASPKTDGGWFWNSQHIKSPALFSYDGGRTWQSGDTFGDPSGAFAIYGTRLE